MAGLVANLAGPGAAFLFWCFWCFWGRRSDLPRISLKDPSRMIPFSEPGEETTLFGDTFSIEPLAMPDPSTHTACFVMARH
jgi:hypothetical protein